MAVEAKRWKFEGFFVEDSKITTKELFGHKIQGLGTLKDIGPCLLLLTDELSGDTISSNNIENIDTLNLLNYYKE